MTDTRSFQRPHLDLNNSTFGDLLREYRHRVGMTQKILADLSTVSTRTIRDLEAGRARPRHQTVELLADGLGLHGLSRDVLRDAARGDDGQATQVDDIGHGSVPAPVDTLIGRSVEVRTVVDTIATGVGRLVSIVGLSGVGKTRVAVAAVTRIRAIRRWPVLWVPVSQHAAGKGGAPLAALVRQAFSTDAPDSSSLARLARLIGQNDILVVLDGMADAARYGATILDLLYRCPGLHVIGTALAPWRIPGSYNLTLPALPVPPIENTIDLTRISTTPSARLLLDRLARTRGGFTLTEGNAPDIVRLCRSLSGIPFALELAASHCLVRTPHQLASNPPHQLLELAIPGGSNGQPITIRRTVGRSMSLLDSRGLAALGELARLEARWTLEDAVVVLRERPADIAEMLSTFTCTGLVDADYRNGESHFAVPNLVRMFLAERG